MQFTDLEIERQRHANEVHELERTIEELRQQVAALEGSLAEVKRPMPLAVGDWIRVDRDLHPYFRSGDIGCVLDFHDTGHLRVDFSKHQGERVHGDGIWYVSRSKITRLETPDE